MKELNTVFKVLGDITRVRILKMLTRRKMCVCEIAFVLGISQPAVSKQLKKMVKAGLLDCEQEGFWTNYFINPKNRYAKKLLEILAQWLNDEAVVKKDLKMAEKADRKKLYCCQ